MTYFWILWGFVAIIALVVLYFFFIGMADGSVSASNMGLWMAMLGVVAAVLLGSLWLKSQERLGLAKCVLYILAVPGFLYLLFLLLVIIGKPRWN
ncbi:MAG: osmoprotectant transporter permease [Saprospiraceae bacterium]|nr:osmoprotectant transporter permease [Saprospiraceae bacterium]